MKFRSKHPPLATIIQIASLARGLDPAEVTRRYSKPARGSAIRAARCEAVYLALGAGYTRAEVARALGVDWATVRAYERETPAG
jgi:DNA-binding NarL/FixJ family response regulator